MGRRPVRIPGAGHPLLDIHSGGRAGPATWRSFSPAEVQQIARTVRRTPEVMVKVTGGGTKRGAVSAHLDYISRHGELETETDDGERVRGRDGQKELLKNWHLELTTGHYRPSREAKEASRPVKLVHNIVLSMPAPTPPEKVLASARKFAREKFGASHRYAMVLHTDQPNPHVHIVVKAESEYGRRLHIDKQMLREWREDFARLMREQGVAANATPRIVRGRNKGKTKDVVFRAQERGASHALRERVAAIARELRQTGTVTDPPKRKLMETRKAVMSHWTKTADVLDAQGEAVLAGEVRQFARRLSVLTDKERIAAGLVRILEANRSEAARGIKPDRERGDDLTR
jgi:hypothetical protein